MTLRAPYENVIERIANLLFENKQLRNERDALRVMLEASHAQVERLEQAVGKDVSALLSKHDHDLRNEQQKTFFMPELRKRLREVQDENARLQARVKELEKERIA